MSPDEPAPEPEEYLRETLVGVLPRGRYELRQRSDGAVEVIRLDRPSQARHGFWNGLEPFDRESG